MNYEHPEYKYSAPINLEETRLGYFDVITYTFISSKLWGLLGKA